MISPLYSLKDIKSKMDKFGSNVDTAIVAILSRRGEQFVSDCRNESTYTDQTGNLRSSIGYFIFKGNSILQDGFSGNKSTGNTQAESMVSKVAKEEGVYYLIGVAGMNYAGAVESKGYNVVSNQSLQIIKLIEGDFDKLKNKYSS